MINLRTPGDGPPWLPAFASSIAGAFRSTMAAPFRFWDVATANLPDAADWTQGLIYDATTKTLKYSNGTSWLPLATESLIPNASYRLILDSSGSHIAGRVAGTYGLGQGDPIAISGTGTLYPLNVIHIAAADYPTVGALAAKLRIRAVLAANDVAPGHNFVFGLHPVTRPATSGGAGLCIYTIGAAVAGSSCTFTTPAADSHATQIGADFALPADGPYVIGAVTNGTTAASSHVHISAALQMRNA